VVKLKDGKVVTSVPWKTKYDVNASDPIVFGNKIFISSGYDHGCALFEFKNKRLKQIWFNKNLRCQFSTPVLYKGYIYGSDGKTGKGTIVAVSINDGSEAWREEKAGYGSLIIADNRIIYLTDRGKLIVGKVSPSSFKREISQYVLTKAGKCWTMPVLANKKLYCRGGNGKLICIDMR
jgi:outer membrane protein assembly factor BamB